MTPQQPYRAAGPATERLAAFMVTFIEEQRWKRWLWKLAALVTLLYLLFLVRQIILPLAIAFLIAMVLDPVVDRMERRGWARLWASAFIFTSFLIITGGLIYLATPPLMRQAQTLTAKADRILPDRSPAGVRVALADTNLPPTIREAAVRAYERFTTRTIGSTTYLGERVMELMSNLIWLAIIPIIAFYALKDFHLILAKMLLLVPKERRDLVQTMVAEVTGVFGKYMRGLVTVSFLNGLTTWLVLLVIGVPGAFMLGVIAAIVYGIPYIGAMITVALIGVVSFIAGGPEMMLIAVAANLVLHQLLFDQIVTPRLLGHHVGLHPIFAIIALLIGNLLLGLLGMILAVPIAACIQIFVVALEPKLRHEIDLDEAATDPPPDTVPSLKEEAKEKHLAVDATEELHKTITDAVEHIEEEVEKVKEEEKAAESPDVRRGA
jgi:predicted PurR-regulated permease PerM